MKAFKKLAAIVLAGVMALAVLTGCSSNDKDTFQKKLDEALNKAGITATMNGAQGNKAQWIAVNYESEFANKIESIYEDVAKGEKSSYYVDGKWDQKKLNADLAAVGDNFATKSGFQQGMDHIEFIPASKDDATMVSAFVTALTGTDAVNYSYSYSTCGKNMEFNDQTGKFETGNFIVLVYETKTK